MHGGAGHGKSALVVHALQLEALQVSVVRAEECADSRAFFRAVLAALEMPAKGPSDSSLTRSLVLPLRVTCASSFVRALVRVIGGVPRVLVVEHAERLLRALPASLTALLWRLHTLAPLCVVLVTRIAPPLLALRSPALASLLLRSSALHVAPLPPPALLDVVVNVLLRLSVSAPRLSAGEWRARAQRVLGVHAARRIGANVRALVAAVLSDATKALATRVPLAFAPAAGADPLQALVLSSTRLLTWHVLLFAAYLASHMDARHDAAVFSESHHSRASKRARVLAATAPAAAANATRSFPLERLLAIARVLARNEVQAQAGRAALLLALNALERVGALRRRTGGATATTQRHRVLYECTVDAEVVMALAARLQFDLTSYMRAT